MSENDIIQGEDLRKMPCLIAMILEGLRRHLPGHLLLAHAVTEEDVVLDGYLVPEDGIVNFMVAEMGWDPIHGVQDDAIWGREEDVSWLCSGDASFGLFYSQFGLEI
ncbi:Cytochrome P [Trema orientale]|uniref:Cytochrome P n=1 Tax=Trema orientale TaxID=63057 RepID=A0A2P5FTS1_TREOI|nr:Cytochrome P [Trema orientale]